MKRWKLFCLTFLILAGCESKTPSKAIKSFYESVDRNGLVYGVDSTGKITRRHLPVNRSTRSSSANTTEVIIHEETIEDSLDLARVEFSIIRRRESTQDTSTATALLQKLGERWTVTHIKHKD
jgi:hypothetical protein